jgi:HEAT repeat protein
MLECCGQLAEARDEAESALALRALVDEGVLREGCLSALDDPAALGPLAECHELLATARPFSAEEEGVRPQLRAAILASLACRCAAGEPREEELHRWAERAENWIADVVDAGLWERPAAADQPLSWLLSCFHHRPAESRAEPSCFLPLVLLALREHRAIVPAVTHDLHVLIDHLRPWLSSEPPEGALPEDVLLGLAQLLQAGGPAIRELVLYWLQRLGERAANPACLASLVHLAGSPDPRQREDAALALACLGEAAANPDILAVALHLFRDPDESVVEAAGELGAALCWSAVREQMLPHLLVLLGSDEPAIRRAACRAVSADPGGAFPTEFQAGVLTLLRDPRADVRAEVCSVLSRFLEEPTPAVLAALAACLEDGEGKVRSSALDAVESRSPKPTPEEVSPALTRLLRDPDPSLRSRASQALSQVKEPQRLVTPAFLLAMEHIEDEEDWGLRLTKLRLLQQVGETGLTPAVQEGVRRLLADPNVYVLAWRIVCAHAARFRPPLLLPALVRYLQHPDEGVREQAREALARLGAAGCTPQVLDTLGRLARHEERPLRLTACRTVRSLGPPAAVDHLCARVYDLLDDPDTELQIVAIRTLVALAPALERKSLAAALTRVQLSCFKRMVREEAADALERLGLA